MFEKGKKIIQKKISYLNYLKMITEVDNLKKLLMNKEQMLLFNLLSKPSLTFPKELEEENKEEDEEEENEDILNIDCLKDVKVYLEKISRNPQRITELDKKLLACMDYDLAIAFAKFLEFRKQEKL